jgi:hypothetical protein
MLVIDAGRNKLTWAGAPDTDRAIIGTYLKTHANWAE